MKNGEPRVDRDEKEGTSQQRKQHKQSWLLGLLWWHVPVVPATSEAAVGIVAGYTIFRAA